MGTQAHRPVIVRAVFLDRSGMRETGRVRYAFLILDDTGTQIVSRPFAAGTLAEVIAWVNAEKKKAKIGRVKFDPPPGVDGMAGKHPRRYDALTLDEIYYASPALGQS
jgi:hypothetical protein